MKPVLYINNFRGFKDTFLELTRVNFFVGENSTGKTSILKLIKIVSDPEFWFKNNSDHFRKEFGYYSEITDTDFFEVGLVSEKANKFICLKFINSNGFAELTEIKQLDVYINVFILVNKRGVEYKYKKGDFTNLFDANYIGYFKNWIKTSDLNSEESYFDKFLKGLHVPLILQVQLIISKHLDKKEANNVFLLPHLVDNMAWLAPIRTEPKRTYDDYELSFSPNGTHVPYVLKKQLSVAKSTKQSKKFETILNRFGEDSGLFEKITVTQYSKSNLSPFDINVIINGKQLKIINVGYGISQILPIIVETVIRPNGSWFALQQPEIHLHPRGQAAFGDLLYKSALTDNKAFVVETHSDFTIDRYRLRLNKHSSEEGNDKIAGQVVFFNRTSDGNELNVIEINSDGSYSDNQPKEFKDFFIKEELALLQL